jgi:ArsR family transcriptional regulator
MNSVFKALSDPTRREILQLLREREMTASEIAERFDLAKPTLSGHFAVLREADLVRSEKSGTRITYWLNLSVLEETMWLFMRSFGASPPEPSPSDTIPKSALNEKQIP